jgi:DNA-binding CsgD family transcriptional regulator
LIGGAPDLHRMTAHVGEAINAAELAPEHWREVAARLHGCAPGTKILLQTMDKATFLLSPMVSLGFGDRLLDVIGTSGAPPYPWKEAWSKVEPFQAAWSDNYFANRLLKMTDYYAEVLRPEGEADSATGMLVADDPDRLSAIAIHYESRIGERTNAILQPLLQHLAGRLRRAIDINRVIARAAPTPIGDAGLLHLIAAPAFIVDDRLRLLAANRAADTLLAERDVMRACPGDRLQLTDPVTHQAFAALVEQICLRPAAASASRPLDDLVIEHPAQGFALTVLPVRRNNQRTALQGVLPLFVPGTVALAILRPLLPPASDPAAQLSQRYGLTRSEIRLALALREGGTLSAVADRLGVSRETVRSHLRSVFAKTGTHRQRELVALVLKVTGGFAVSPPGSVP